VHAKVKPIPVVPEVVTLEGFQVHHELEREGSEQHRNPEIEVDKRSALAAIWVPPQ